MTSIIFEIGKKSKACKFPERHFSGKAFRDVTISRTVTSSFSSVFFSEFVCKVTY